jgi:alpha-galactosidase
MGWNSWNKFGCNVSEDLIRSVADSLVATGMRDAGYQYLVIDDCWQVDRDANGNIVADAQRFPSGIKALADYVHGKGLKFGIYSDAGTGTCQNRPGSRGYEFQDARQYAAWGVDYLKYDWCNATTQNSKASYALMSAALAKSGRPIVFSLCEWGSTQPWLWARDAGNLWRTTGDIVDKWSGSEKWGGLGVVQIIDLQNGLESYAGPGHWNDPDMLEVGNSGMTDTEYRAHFSMWALLAAPLMAGNDIRSMRAEIRDILTNREVIAVDQDALGLQGRRVRKEGDFDVWARQLADGGRAVVLLNRGTAEAGMTVKWTDIGYPDSLPANVRDLWAGRDLGKVQGSYSATVPGHGAVMLRIRP